VSEPGEPGELVWDSLADLVAMVQCFRGQDEEGLRVLLANCNKPMVLAIAIHLLSQVAREHGASYRELLAWGLISMDQAT
jgi:hypothetical protein